MQKNSSPYICWTTKPNDELTLHAQISLPPLEVQQELVNANSELIRIFEQQIKDEINKL